MASRGVSSTSTRRETYGVICRKGKSRIIGITKGWPADY